MIDAIKRVRAWLRRTADGDVARVHGAPSLAVDTGDIAALLSAYGDAVAEAASVQARLTRVLDERDARERRAAGIEARIGDLLAVIFGDGGHHAAEVGIPQACRDAESRVIIARHDADRGVKLDRLVRDYLDAEDAYETEDDRMALGKMVDDARMALCVALGRGR